ncbi:MAG: TraR/DksA C4-type zinc finger protein [Dermatophilaceae bacterium]
MAVKKTTSVKKAVPVRKGAPAKSTPKAVPAAKASAAPKSTTKATPARKVPAAPQSTAKAAPARKPAATKSTSKAAPAKRAATRSAAGSAGATTARAPRSMSKASAVAAPLRAQKTSARASTSQPRPLRVREDETPWTARELKAVRADLEADVARLLHEISVAESELAGLMRDAGDGSGDDQADAGTKTFEREQEISLANNARIMFEQSEHALARIDDRTYGICESCGNPIGKNRLLAFPRATLCMPCKSKQERR